VRVAAGEKVWVRRGLGLLGIAVCCSRVPGVCPGLPKLAARA
jgi:hypothetical protein